MEDVRINNQKIREFIEIFSGYGFGNGSGSGNGNGSGYGYGDGYGSGNGNGDGYGYGDGYGDGYGNGDGYGYGDGYGSGISVFNNQIVNYIDGVATIIKAVFLDYAKGYILQRDLTLKPCYVAKNGNTFAHGETLAEAVRALNDKLFDDLDEDERIAAFWECHENGVKYPAMDLYDWHHKLTGSCEMGRRNFAAERGIDLDKDEFTVDEFIKLCCDSYGGEIITKLNDGGK